MLLNCEQSVDTYDSINRFLSEIVWYCFIIVSKKRFISNLTFCEVNAHIGCKLIITKPPIVLISFYWWFNSIGGCSSWLTCKFSLIEERRFSKHWNKSAKNMITNLPNYMLLEMSRYILYLIQGAPCLNMISILLWNLWRELNTSKPVSFWMSSIWNRGRKLVGDSFTRLLASK